MKAIRRVATNRLYFIVFVVLSIAFSVLSVPALATTLATRQVTSLYQLTGEQGSQFSFPSDLAASSSHIYVVDGGNHRVVVFNKDGQSEFTFGSYGDDEGQFNYPVGIFVKNKRVYVADSGNHRIQIFTLSGQFVSSFPVLYKSKPVRPVDLIVHSQTQNIIVTASESHSLMVYNQQGKLLEQWGSNGTNQGEFRYPATIAEMPDRRIAVVDVLNTRIQVFDQSGKATMIVGDWGVLEGQLVRPKGIAIDANGRFYVSDSYMNVVQIFSDTGNYVAVIGSKDEPLRMVTPVGMMIDNNKLYVVEMRAHRVSVYGL